MTVSFDHDAISGLLGAYAVDAIDDETERTAVEAHLATCADCRREVSEHFEALAALTSPADHAPSAIWDSISAAIAGSPAVDRGGAGAIHRLWPRRAAALTASAAAVAASVLLTLVVAGGDGLGSPVRTASVLAATPVSNVTGTAQLFDPDRPTGQIVIDLRNVPAAPSGHHYEVWVLRPGKDVEMEAVGAFTPHDGRARLVLRLPGAGEYVAVDISIQENGGSPEHSGKSLAGATFQ